jgi:CRP-like cAMP-binding protein
MQGLCKHQNIKTSKLMDTVPAIEMLKEFPLFQGFNHSELSHLESIIECKSKPKFSTFYDAGDATCHLYFLLKGTVKTCKNSPDGREVIKTILHPVSMFGELGIVGEKYRHETAETMNKEAEYVVIALQDFQRFMRSQHSLCLKFLEMIGSRLLRVEEKLESLIFKDARARIIDFLVESATQRGRRVGFEMLFKHCLTQQDIANLTGTSRQTVTSVLNELKKENLIYFNRNTILIRDMARLS